VLDLRPNRPLRSEAATEVERLQRELRRVTTERDILKKALGYFAKDPQ
jgi:transposase